MASRLWQDVDRYITDTLVQPDEALDAALAASDAAGLPPISVSPAHGKLLWLLARTLGAKRILTLVLEEVGDSRHGAPFGKNLGS